MDLYEFYSGRCFDAYNELGAHVVKENVGKSRRKAVTGVDFVTYAPNAESVTVTGEFNSWGETAMERCYDGSFFKCFVPGAKAGQMYKYKIYQRDGYCVDHCDPYGFGMELRPNSASIVRDMSKYKFKDSKWMQNRSDCRKKPLNIYEIHFGSFRKPSDKTDDWYTYEEMIDILIPYLTENGYNYLEIMPLNEYPCDESWGYQATGFFSPTSRYGTADQLKAFVDACHKHGIGVLMDFVPVHFAVDAYGLANYDGTALYEYPNSAVGVSEWGSCNFMHSRGETRSFLQSCANYWMSEFHMDGIRMDAISRAIYWQGDPARAVEFLQYMNQGLKNLHPSAILAAEDSTSFPKVTDPVSQGGLGFDYKWDMGWMNDTLDYFRTGPEYRTDNYHKLTFSMMYYYDSRFLLPLSHDEVVHGKATIMQKMSGDYDNKFPQARALYMYMYAHPGKKLNFMGNEIAQFREWDEKRQQDWDILKFPKHKEFHRFMMELNEVYEKHSAFWEADYAQDGFRWIDCHQEEKCIYAFERKSKKERIVAVFHFGNTKEQEYVMKISGVKKLKLICSSDDSEMKKAHPEYQKDLPVKKGAVSIHLPAYSARFYQVVE